MTAEVDAENELLASERDSLQQQVFKLEVKNGEKWDPLMEGDFKKA